MGGAGQPADVENEGSDVFLSYSRDEQAIAQKVHDLLEQAGVSVWWDAMLEGGVRFHDVTEFNLEYCEAVVVLWSEISTKSHWVHDEATRGRDRGCLIPVSIDGTLPPLGFRQFQWIDVSKGDWSLDDPAIQKLVRAVEAKCTGETSPAFTPPAGLVGTQGTAKPSNPAISRRTALIGGGAGAFVLASGGIVAWRAGLIGSDSPNRRLAVMPFEIMGDAGEKDYFLEGFATEIRSLLARNPLLHVAAKASSNAFREGGATAGEICDKLGVDYLLTGDIRVENDRLIGHAEFAEGKKDRVLQPFDIDTPIENVLDIQRQIAGQIVQDLAAEEAGAGSAEQLGGTENIAAYDAFLRGRELYEAGTDEGTDRAALAQFDEALRLDPEYAAALAMRGRTLGLIGNLYAGVKERAQVYSDAIEAAETAVAIAPAFADGYAVLALVRSGSQLDMKAAVEPYERAYKLGRGDADILSRYGVFRARMGDFDGARKAIEAAIALDPLNSRVFRFAGYIDYDAGNFSKAIEHFDEALELQNPLSSYHYLVGLAQLAMGDIAAAKTSFEADGFFVWNKTGLAIVEHKLGNIAAAKAHLAELQERQGDKSNYQYMQIYSQWGNTDAALAAMDAAWNARDTGMIQVHNDPLLEPIRGTPRFRQLEQRMGFV